MLFDDKVKVNGLELPVTVVIIVFGVPPNGGAPQSEDYWTEAVSAWGGAGLVAATPVPW